MIGSKANNPQIELLPEGTAIWPNFCLKWSELEEAKQTQKKLPAKIIDSNIDRREFIVSFGNGYTAVLPFEDSIYRGTINLLSRNGNLSRYSTALIGENVYVLITDIDNSGYITVSRKPLLKQAYQKIRELCENENPIFQCRAIYNTAKSAMVDMGGGILGIIPIQELSMVVYNNIENWIKTGDTFFASFYEFDQEKNMFILSRKQYYGQHSTVPQIGEQIYVKTGKITESNPFGRFVELTPGIAGVLNKPRHFYEEGTLVKAKVSCRIEDPQILCGYRIQLIPA